MIRFLQNDLAKQQNQSSTDQFIRSVKIHSFVVFSAFIASDASKAVKSAKLSDEKALTDNNENEFENWLNEMKNKLQNNVDWYSIETNKIDYVRSQLAIDDDVVKHVRARLRSDSDKFFQTIEKVLQMLIKMYEDSNKKETILRKFSNLKQVEKYKEFSTFWAEFQRLAHELDHSKKTLLNELRLKMSFQLQKTLAIEFYRATDIHEFVKLCMHTKRIWKSIDAKKRISSSTDSRKSTRTEAEDTSIVKFIVITVSSSIISRDTSTASTITSFRCFEISTRSSHSNPVTKKLLAESRCFRCDEINHMKKDCSNQKIRINVVTTNEEMMISEAKKE